MALDDFVNTGLMSHPYNYVVVVLSLALVTLGLCLILAPLGTIGGITQVY